MESKRIMHQNQRVSLPPRALAPLAALSSLAMPIAAPAGQELFDQDDPADDCYQIVSGCVRTVRLMEDGRRQIGGFLMAGDVLGFDAGDQHDEAAQAVVPTLLHRYPARAVHALAARDAGFAQWLWREAAGQLHRARLHAMLLGRKTATERVASFLCDMQARAPHDGDGQIALPMHRADIADYLGLTVETVSRTLTQLRQRRVIDIVPGKIAVRSLRHLATTADAGPEMVVNVTAAPNATAARARSHAPAMTA